METNLDGIPSLKPPFWYVKGHTHTIGRSLLSSSNRPAAERIEISTPDNDFLELDLIEQEDPLCSVGRMPMDKIQSKRSLNHLASDQKAEGSPEKSGRAYR